MIITHRLQTWETVEEICESEKAQEIKKTTFIISPHTLQVSTDSFTFR